MKMRRLLLLVLALALGAKSALADVMLFTDPINPLVPAGTDHVDFTVYVQNVGPPNPEVAGWQLQLWISEEDFFLNGLSWQPQDVNSDSASVMGRPQLLDPAVGPRIFNPFLFTFPGIGAATQPVDLFQNPGDSAPINDFDGLAQFTINLLPGTPMGTYRVFLGNSINPNYSGLFTSDATPIPLVNTPESVIFSFDYILIPEPTACALTSLGMLAIAAYVYRRKRFKHNAT